MPSTRRHLGPVVLAVIMALLGLALTVGGGWLVALQGSWYYLLAGLVMLVTAWLLWRRQLAALWLYALLTAATLAWAVWEAGLDWWPLAARGDIIFLLGLFFLLPWVTRGLHEPEAARPVTAF